MDQLNQADSSKIARNTGITGAAEIPLQLISFLSGIIITRVLGANIFGVFVAASAVTNIGRIIATLGLQKGVLRYIGLCREEQPQVNGIVLAALALTLSIGALIVLLLTLLSGTLATHVFAVDGIGGAIALLAWAIPFTSVFLVLTSVLQAFESITLMAILRKVVQPLLMLALLLLFFWFGMRLSALIWRMIVANLLLGVVAFYYVRRLPQLNRLAAPRDFSRVPALLRFGVPLFVAEIIHIFMLRSDVLMISAFLTADQVGIYGVVVRLTGLLLVPLVSLDTIIFPMLSGYLARDDTASVGRIYRLSSHWAMLTSLPLYITAWVYAADLLALFGTEFSGGVVALRVIIIGLCFRSLAGAVAGVLIIGGHSKLIMINSAIAASMNLAANYQLIPRFGIEGAAIATAFITAFWSLLMVAQVRKIHHLHPWSLLTVRSLLLALLTGLLFTWLPLPLPGWLRLLVGALAITCFFFGGVLVSRSVTAADKYILAKLMMKAGLRAPAGWVEDNNDCLEN